MRKGGGAGMLGSARKVRHMHELGLIHVASGAAFSLLGAALCVFIHYEGLNLLEKFSGWESHLLKRARPRMLLVMMGVILLHTLEIWAMAAVYGVMAEFSGMGGIQVAPGVLGSFTHWDYVYFSAVMYSSLGIGDLIPHGMFKMLATTEALVGLILIAWSASFTYLLMQRLWGKTAR